MPWIELDPDLSHPPVLADHGVGVEVLFARDAAIAAEMHTHGVRSSAETFGDRPMPVVEARAEVVSHVAPQVGAMATYAA